MNISLPPPHTYMNIQQLNQEEKEPDCDFFIFISTQEKSYLATPLLSKRMATTKAFRG